MHIVDEDFYSDLAKALCQRGSETRQRVLYRTLRESILSGRLPAQSRLPGSRAFAELLKLSRNTVNAAFEQLATEGYLQRSRQGTQIAALPSPLQGEVHDTPEIVLPEALVNLPQGITRHSPALPFTPGMPAVNYFPLPLWRRLLDRVLKEEGNLLLGYGDSAGEWSLRVAIARYLALSRGIYCDASQVVITEGGLEGINLCTQLLSKSGQTAWTEDPGYYGAYSTFLTAGLRIEGMPVDKEGMYFPDNPQTIPSLIFTSPSHQYPVGSLMSASRRLALLKFALRNQVWIIEDDYDSEFRYGAEPIPAMYGMIPNAPVVYLGTFSKTVFPSLRIGFVVMPMPLAKAARTVINSLLRGGHRAEQQALARFIEEGHYARHLASMRRLYRKRHEQLQQAIAQELKMDYGLSGEAGGMHLTVTIDGVDDRRVVALAREYQLAPAALSRFYLDPAKRKTGLVLGYGNTSASYYASAIKTLNKLLIRTRRG